ncbi:hypothetical protein [Streptomyces canus]|uniref:hypothetical protein n=1 Tax=Streptomyces canus TaxID=58343 RepID=UPI002786D081|nr:hypothetical protein [Streptomyces canus]MDQ0767037.1 hypothetical protein [Streptomyces canus]MDQ1065074.1 hypothetical protein [Streptomyces canus]
MPAMAHGGFGRGFRFAVGTALVTEVLPDSRGGAADKFGVLLIATVLLRSVARGCRPWAPGTRRPPP